MFSLKNIFQRFLLRTEKIDQIKLFYNCNICLRTFVIVTLKHFSSVFFRSYPLIYSEDPETAYMSIMSIRLNQQGFRSMVINGTQSASTPFYRIIDNWTPELMIRLQAFLGGVGLGWPDNTGLEAMMNGCSARTEHPFTPHPTMGG